MKIDFRKIEVKGIDGNSSTVDLSKLLGNAIYNNTPDLGELKIAQDIYDNGEVDLIPEQAEPLKRYASMFSLAYAQAAILSSLDEIINSKK